jgi:hypothetical protein
MTILFSSMKALTELNLSKNKIKCKAVKAISKALIFPAEAALTILSLDYCDIAKEGLDALFGDLRTNKKIISLSIDGNILDDDTLKGHFLESFDMNKTLQKISIADCRIDDFKIHYVISALSVN